MTLDEVMKFFLALLAYGGGAAAIAYGLFQWLGKTWIENKFAERLRLLEHDQALELQRLRVEIDSMLSGALKLQEREFSILPETWAKLYEAHGLVSWLVSPMQQYADVDRMKSVQLEEFLEGTGFSDSQKEEIRSAPEKGRRYQEIVFWHRLSKVKTAINELQSCVAKNGIFLPSELEEKFSTISEMLWSAVISKEVGHQAEDWKMQQEGWKKIKEETEPLYLAIKRDIQARLQSHARRV